MSKRDQDIFRIDVISGIDDEIVDHHLKKRFALWFKNKKRRPRWVPLVAALLSVVLVCGGVFVFLPLGDAGKQVPIYLGMTVSNEAPAQGQLDLPAQIDAPALIPLAELIPIDEEENESKDKDGNSNDNDNGSGNDNKDNNGNNGNKDEPIIFGETYYAKKHEDIYIHIHFSNPDEFEILSFTLNGVKYSTYMFEQGSDLQTLILKYNVGDANGLQEYTIDAIKYVDGEKIKDVRMQGDQTVKVYVNDEMDLLQFNAQLSFTTLTIAPTRPLLSLALYEGDVKLRELSPTDTTIENLPFDKRLILRATYSDGAQTRTAQHIFDTQQLSQGLVIEDGVIRGLGSCTDTVLYVNHPIGNGAFTAINSIEKVYMGPGVTSIGSEAFFECKSLNVVVLPETLAELGSSAFSYTGITAITIPRKITSLPEQVFEGCENLSEVTLHDDIETIGNHAFYTCSSLTSITLPDGLLSIEEWAFHQCKALTEINLPDGLEFIGDCAFNNCVELKEVTLPDSLTFLEGKPFSGCSSMTSLTIPGCLEKIEDMTFIGNRNTALESITILEGVKIIGWGAFADHPMLTEVTLPASVTSLAPDVFNNSPNLKELYFEGTKAEWSRITKGFSWKGNTPISVIHCSDGDISP